MPDFADPFSGVVPKRTLTLGELTRALRLDLCAEEEAIHLYEAQAEASDNPLAAKVLLDIANEERVHVGEFQRLLNLLLADEQGFLDEGAAEVDEMAAGGPTGEAGLAEAEPAEAEATEQASVRTIGTLR